MHQSQPESESTQLTHRLHALEGELHQLRRTNSRWRRGLVAVLLLGAAAMLIGAGTGGTLTGESIRLVKAGKLRALMSVTSSGTAALSLMGADGKVSSIMSVSSTGIPKISFVKNGGKTVRMTLSETSKGNLALILNDTMGRLKASVLVDSRGEGSVTVMDAAGRAK